VSLDSIPAKWHTSASNDLSSVHECVRQKTDKQKMWRNKQNRLRCKSRFRLMTTTMTTFGAALMTVSDKSMEVCTSKALTAEKSRDINHGTVARYTRLHVQCHIYRQSTDCIQPTAMPSEMSQQLRTNMLGLSCCHTYSHKKIIYQT